MESSPLFDEFLLFCSLLFALSLSVALRSVARIPRRRSSFLLLLNQPP